MSDDRKTIMSVELIDGKNIEVHINHNFPPILTYALKLLEIQVERMIVERIIKNEINSKGNLIVPEVAVKKDDLLNLINAR